jgi:hypothetical protein
MSFLTTDTKAKWFAGAALNTGEQAMLSVMSTALSRLNAFLDSELEQILCFDTAINAEKFTNEKSAIFLIMPEEDPNKDNYQLVIAGGFAPGSKSADIISRALGSRTVMSGTVSRSKHEPSQALQMMERAS